MGLERNRLSGNTNYNLFHLSVCVNNWECDEDIDDIMRCCHKLRQINEDAQKSKYFWGYTEKEDGKNEHLYALIKEKDDFVL